MKNILTILIKINMISFLFSISLLHSAAHPNWNILQLHKTKIYLGLITENNILDMDNKHVPLIFGENQQQCWSKKHNYKFSTGQIKKCNFSCKKIYLTEDIIVLGWASPIIEVVEPRIILQDIYNPESLLYIADRLKSRISPEPVRLEYHNFFAKSEAKKDLKKCYEYLLSYNNNEKNRTIGLLPLKINIDINELIAITVESLEAFITYHKNSYDSIYILLKDYQEYRGYVSLLNRCINTSRY